MPLASTFNLQWYGPAAGAAVASGVGSASAAIEGWATGAASATGVGSVVDADATRLINSPMTVSGVASSTISVIADGTPSMTVSIGSRPSAEDVAQAVWGSNAAALNATGTMGEKLNGAGSAGNPWTETIETGMTAAQALRLITAALAGKISGADTDTVTIRSAVADNADRIIATVDESGNRITLTYDLD